MHYIIVYVALHVDFFTSFCCDVLIAQMFDGPFNCYDTMKKFANGCEVAPFANRD